MFSSLNPRSNDTAFQLLACILIRVENSVDPDQMYSVYKKWQILAQQAKGYSEPSLMFKWLFHILIFATNDGSGKYQNNEKPVKRQRKLELAKG